MHGRIALAFAALLAVTGLSPSSAQSQDYANMLLDIPTSQGALDDVAHLNEEAHYAGTIGDRDMAYWMRDKLRSYGFKTSIETVYAPVPQLKRAVLQLLVKPRVDFALNEAPIPSDPDGSRHDAGIPFNAWSGSGDVTARLVYVNDGRSADYRTLANAHVSVAGAIALIRYGREFRGELARRAARHGAVGVIFYSDPAGPNGSAHGAPYPDGPYRPLGSVQRGSLNAPAMKIPVLPISAINARRLLADITGPTGPRWWRGGLDADYAIGTSNHLVHLRVDESYSWVTLWNTIGVLPGLDTSRKVIFGGHRDAWVYGATDNGSGISTLLEAARALGYIYRSGWRPHYSVEIAGWDGEEVGELGSNAYVHTHQAELRHGAIAYINADETATGRFFAVSAVAGLAQLVPQVARHVPDPRVKASTLLGTWRAQTGGVRTYAPAGGSDDDPFLYLLGVPTLQFGFEGPFGVYHSAFDDVRYATTEADPDFATHRTLAQLLALLAYRMTLGPLPYDFRAYVERMDTGLHALGGISVDSAALAPVAAAIERFAAQSDAHHAYDLDDAIEAIHRLDLILYGHAGYAPLIFPQISAALASGNADKVRTSASAVAGAIDGVTALLK